MSSDAPPPYPNVFACVLLSSTDKLRMFGFPEPVVQAIQATVTHAWPKGIQQQGLYQGTWEWKLRGTPWYGQSDEAVLARRLILHVLQTLAANGWMLHSACDLTKKARDKDTLFFRACPPMQSKFFCISFNESDKIRLIDSPSAGITTAFTAAVNSWRGGIQESREKLPGCFQMKLRGNPWLTSNGAEVVAARLLGLNILSAMDHQGYDLAASIDMSIGVSESYTELDTWFFATRAEKTPM